MPAAGSLAWALVARCCSMILILTVSVVTGPGLPCGAVYKASLGLAVRGIVEVVDASAPGPAVGFLIVTLGSRPLT